MILNESHNENSHRESGEIANSNVEFQQFIQSLSPEEFKEYQHIQTLSDIEFRRYIQRTLNKAKDKYVNETMKILRKREREINNAKNQQDEKKYTDELALEVVFHRGNLGKNKDTSLFPQDTYTRHIDDSSPDYIVEKMSGFIADILPETSSRVPVRASKGGFGLVDQISYASSCNIDGIIDENIDIESKFDKMILEKKIQEALDTLTERESRIIQGVYFEHIDKTFKGAADDLAYWFDVTPYKIKQIHDKALRKLRHPSRSEYLKDFLN